jgi:uncharacterized protein YndB with AHSA1/START domain
MSDTAIGVKKRDFVTTRVFEAPVDEVWQAWVEAGL